MLNSRQARQQIPQRIFDAVGVGYWTARAVADQASVDVSCAQKHLKRLYERGFLERARAKGRGTKPRFVFKRKAA